MAAAEPSSANPNQLAPADRAVHRWYRFVLSFPPHLVRTYLQRFNLGPEQRVLDPFAGTGTTLVECKKQGLAAVGLDANPMAHFACQTKLNWQPNPHQLQQQAQAVAQAAHHDLRWFPGDGLRQELPAASQQVLLRNCISPVPLHKALVLQGHIQHTVPLPLRAHCQLALVRAVVGEASNLRFAPEASVVRAREDAPVVEAWLAAVADMAADLATLPPTPTPSAVHRADARAIPPQIAAQSIDAVITSPPYPNEKDYTRNTRLESVLLGLICDRQDLRQVKQTLLRSNSRNIYVQDQDHQAIAHIPTIAQLAATIDQRRADLGKTSGFSRLYGQVVRQYFGGIHRHLASLRRVLRPGASLAYVVGDQASYLGVLISTGPLIAALAEDLGYQVTDIDLFRTRRATATNQQLREEVLLLRWPRS